MNKLLALGAHEELDIIKERLHALKINLTTSFFSTINMFISNKEIKILVNGENILEFDHVWLTSSWNLRSIAYAVSLFLEGTDTDYSPVEEEKSKLVDMMIFAQNDIPIPNTFFTGTENFVESIDSIIEFCGFPFIFKPIRGSLGKNVYLINSKEELKEVVEKKIKGKNLFICQSFIPNKFDYRILIGDGKVVSACKRVRQDEAFRNNTFLGATEYFLKPHEIDSEIIGIAKNSANILELDWAGVDIVTSTATGKNYIIELNRRPGLTKGSTEILAVYEHILGINLE